jgi:hypothetical protein
LILAVSDFPRLIFRASHGYLIKHTSGPLHLLARLFVPHQAHYIEELRLLIGFLSLSAIALNNPRGPRRRSDERR